MEDNVADVFLVREAIQAAQIQSDVLVVRDGEEATQLFDHVDRDESKPCPTLVILDINLPKKKGGDVLQHMRNSERTRDALVIVVSTSDSPTDRQQMMELGANAYFRKASEYEDFLQLGDLIRDLVTQKR